MARAIYYAMVISTIIRLTPFALNVNFLSFERADRDVLEQPEPAPLRWDRRTPYQPEHVDVQPAGQPGPEPTRSDFGPQRQQVRRCRLWLAL